jgi:hypothetical protein
VRTLAGLGWAVVDGEVHRMADVAPDGGSIRSIP